MSLRRGEQGLRMKRLLGRQSFLGQVEEAALRGSTVLVLGPVGIGKSAILAELGRRLSLRDLPCGLAPDTRCLGDVTAALARAYPGACDPTMTQRQLRSRLRLAVEARSGALLLDHVRFAGTSVKGFLRSLRGTGLGVVLAADVENQRDHAAIRALHLTHIEFPVPPLSGRTMAAILGRLLASRRLPHALCHEDRKRLLHLARGNPGRLVAIADLSAEVGFWRGDRVRTSALDMAASELVLRTYLAT